MGRRIIVMTHKGWFGLCPVWAGDLHEERCFLEARHRRLDWLFDASSALFAVMHTIQAALGADDLRFPLRLTGKIRPRLRVIDDPGEA